MKEEYKKILVIADNLFMYSEFRKIIRQANLKKTHFTYRFSNGNKDFLHKFSGKGIIKSIDVRKSLKMIIASFDFVISVHSKQIFPKEMIRKIKCINIHPGYNPYNRGWFPHVFSIINGMPLGATIHEMDEQVDHGYIIDQVKVPLYPWDTSLSVYNRVLKAEIELTKKNIVGIIKNNYDSKKPVKEGNLNLKKDFKALCKIDFNEQGQFGEFINRMRALSHGNYKNAYFVDKKSGKKIFVSVNLKLDE